MKTEIEALLLQVTGKDALPANADLLASGVIDSFGILQLIQELESKFGFSFDDADLDAGNFRSVDQIAALVAKKVG